MSKLISDIIEQAAKRGPGPYVRAMSAFHLLNEDVVARGGTGDDRVEITIALFMSVHVVEALIITIEVLKERERQAQNAGSLPKPSIPADAVCLFMDGNKLAAVRPDFINLQESPAGFGATPGEAIDRLKADIELQSQSKKG